MLKRMWIFSILSFLFVIPSICDALVYNYIGTGTIVDLNGVERIVYAQMDISSELRDWTTDEIYEITPGELLPNAQIYYKIYGSVFGIEGLGEVVGTGGYIYGESVPEYNCLCFFDWDFFGGDPGYIGGQYVGQNHADGTPWIYSDPTLPEYGRLAPRLNLAGDFIYLPDFFDSIDPFQTFNLTIERSANPVPEPATVFLLGIGLVGAGLAGLKNKFKK